MSRIASLYRTAGNKWLPSYFTRAIGIGVRVLDLTNPATAAGFGWVRSGAGTLTDVAGAVRYGAHNLLLHSADITQPSWTKTGVTAVSATEFAETAANAQHGLFRSFSISPGVYTQILRIKPKSGTRFISVYPQGGSLAAAVFNLQTGARTSVFGGGFIDGGLQLMPDGFYRCWVTGNFTGTTLFAVTYATNSAADPAPGFAGDTGVSFDVQLQRVINGPIDDAANDLTTVTTTAPAYLMRTPDYTHGVPGLLLEGARTNLASTAFTNWTIFRSAAPTEGGDGFWSFVATGTAPDFGAFRQNAPTWSSNTGYCFSVEIIPVAGRTYAIEFVDTASGFLGGTSTFAFSTPSSAPTIVNSGRATGQAVLTQRGSWLVWITFTTQAAPNYNYYSARCASHFGSGELLRVTLPQLEVGSYPTSRIPNPGTGTLLRVADVAEIGPGPEFDALFGVPTFGPELLTNGGFDSDTWWGKDGGVSISGGVSVFASVANNTGLFRSLFPSGGKEYLVTYSAVSLSAGGFRWYLNGFSTTARTSPGTYAEFIRGGTSDNVLILRAVGTTTGTVDNASIREVIREGTLVVEWVDIGSTDGDILSLHSGGTTNELLSLYYSGSSILTLCRAGGVNQLSATVGTRIPNALNKASISWGAAGLSVVLNGGTPQANPSATIPAPTHARIAGAALASNAQGARKLTKITTLATQRTGAALQALTV